MFKSGQSMFSSIKANNPYLITEKKIMFTTSGGKLFKENDPIQEATELEKNGKTKDALEIMTSAVKSDPSNKAFRYHMGRLANTLEKEESSETANFSSVKRP